MMKTKLVVRRRISTSCSVRSGKFVSAARIRIVFLSFVVIILLSLSTAGNMQAAQEPRLPGVRFGPPNLITDSMVGAHSVVPADLDRDGDLDLIAVSRLDGQIVWFNNNGAENAAFAALPIANVSGAYAVTPADLNRDGAIDFLVAAVGVVRPASDDELPSGKIIRFISNGNSPPAFDRDTIFEGVEYPVSIHSVDLDSDGDPDVLSASRDDNSIFWYENDGQRDPDFEAHLLTNQAFGAVSVSAADFDGDGDMDVVSASENDDQIAWYENVGGVPAQFIVQVIRTAGDLDPERGDMAKSVMPADIDDDGDVDIVYALEDGNEVGWYENDGAVDPAFSQHTISTEVNHVKFVTAADVDRDGDIDIFSASTGDSTVALFENDGASPPAWIEQPLTTGALGARSVAVADINSDGLLDVVSASRDDNRLLWYPNQTIHRSAYFPTFSRTLLAALQDSRGVDSGDLDHDGDLDVVVVADADVIWIENDGAQPAGFRTHTVATGLRGGRWPHVADLDHDGDLDIVVASTNDDTVSWYENVGGSPSSFTGHIVTREADGPRAALTADLDRDGDLDIYVASDADDSITWYQNLGGRPPQFRRRLIYNEAYFARSIIHADMNGDGAPDLLSASQRDNTIALYTSNGATTTPRFTHEVLRDDVLGVQHVSAADIDGDGDMDVLFASENSAMIGWLENRTAALKQFKLHVVDDDAPGAHAVEGADIDWDGDIDLVGAIQHDNAHIWYENVGGSPPHFVSHLIYDRALAAHAIRPADLDGDGDLDILGISRDDGHVNWFENLGGQFSFELTSSTASDQELAAMQLVHNGRAGDAEVRIITVDLQFLNLGNTPLTTAQLIDLVQELSLYRSSCCGQRFNAAEAQRLMKIEPLILNDQGRLTVDLAANGIDLRIAHGAPVALHLVAEGTGRCGTAVAPIRIVLNLTSRTAIDARYGTPLLAQSMRNLEGAPPPDNMAAPTFLTINEIMSDNNVTLEDPDEANEFPDWIELYNNSSLVADLGGMYLSDDLTVPTKYRIPEGVTIEPFGHIIFIADGDHLQGALHTNFRLDKRGESVGLFDVDRRSNQVLDVHTFGNAQADVAIGRYPDGSGEWRSLPFSSPGSINVVALLEPAHYLPVVAYDLACP